MADRDRTSGQSQDDASEQHARDGASDRGGSGGYGASSGFSEETHAGSDMGAAREEQPLPQHEELQNRPDARMRGVGARRAGSDASR